MEAVEIEIITFSDIEPSEIKFNVILTNWTTTNIDFIIKYENPLLIS